MKSKTLSKYINQYAEGEARELAPLLRAYGPWDSAITVPLFAEAELLSRFLATLEPAVHDRKVLAIFLINGKISSSPEILANNKTSLELLKKHYALTALASNTPAWFGRMGKLDVLVVDRGTKEEFLFPPREGVGLARKIIGDIATALYGEELLNSPWIHCSDGDVLLAPDYFRGTKDFHAKAAGGIYGFAHIAATEPEEQDPAWLALQQYEIWLRYYVLGLRFAGSPYAYCSIGSMIAFHAEHYAASRGFPKREAGEDFYLLNKLRKLGDIIELRQPLNFIRNRPSDRVPFGTGVGTQKIMDLKSSAQIYTIYHPHCFQALKALLKTVTENFAAFDEDTARALFREKLQGVADSNQLRILENLCWEELKIAEQVAASKKRARDLKGALREFHGWFDAFKTLRFVHETRDRVFPNLPLMEAVNAAPFLPDSYEASVPGILRLLRELHP